MEDPFQPGERVVCISDRCPCCDERLNDENRPDVGEVYTVDGVGYYVDSDNAPVLAFVPEIAGHKTWPQCNFKRIPPQVTEKDKRVTKPIDETVS